MSLNYNRRMTLVWLILSAVTLLAWWIGGHRTSGGVHPAPAIAVGAIAITVVKVRLIITEFMDLRHAPVLLRRLLDAWLVCFSGAMLAAYFLAG